MSINVNDNTSALRLEIAVLDEDTNKYHPGKVKFKIPALSAMAKDSLTKTSIKTVNKNAKATKISVTNSSTLDLVIPKSITRFFTKKKIPKGTRFIIGFIGGDIINAKIIAAFDII